MTKKSRALSNRIVFRGRVFHVDRDRVKLPNGREATLDIVRHRGSVVLIPQPSPGKVILIRQYRYAIDRWIWELPAGTLDPGEGPAAAARRECAEEIGLSPARVTKLAEFYPTPGFCDEVMLFYRCTGLTKPRRPPKLDLDEQIEPREFTLAAARRLIRDRQVVDMKTVVGLDLI